MENALTMWHVDSVILTETLAFAPVICESQLNTITKIQIYTCDVYIMYIRSG